ncbi:MAG: transporter, partial [Verrucomicrobia bacterium]|nr:transporter [Verrucomicrobiota bacterium]
GVRGVRNDIVVSDEKDRELRRIAHHNHAMFCETMDDRSITAQLKYELYSHKCTNALKAKVTTSNGHVIIHGAAASPAEKDLVTKLAKSVRGVESVDNNLTVRSSSLSSIK